MIGIIILSFVAGIKYHIVKKINKLESSVRLNYSEVSSTYSKPDTPMKYDVLVYDLMWNLKRDDRCLSGIETYSNDHMQMLIKKDSYNLSADKKNGEYTIDCDAERSLFKMKSQAKIYYPFALLNDELNNATMKSALYSQTESSTLYAFDGENMKLSIIDTSNGMFNVEVFIPGRNYYISFLIVDCDKDVTAENILDFASRISYKV